MPEGDPFGVVDPSRMVMFFAPLPQQLRVSFRKLSTFWLGNYAFCGQKRNFDAQRCALCGQEDCKSTTRPLNDWGRNTAAYSVSGGPPAVGQGQRAHPQTIASQTAVHATAMTAGDTQCEAELDECILPSHHPLPRYKTCFLCIKGVPQTCTPARAPDMSVHGNPNPQPPSSRVRIPNVSNNAPNSFLLVHRLRCLGGIVWVGSISSHVDEPPPGG